MCNRIVSIAMDIKKEKSKQCNQLKYQINLNSDYSVKKKKRNVTSNHKYEVPDPWFCSKMGTIAIIV